MKNLLLFLSLMALGGAVNAQTKYVVLEEHTGFWCQWCPRGVVESQRLQDAYETLIPIEIHSNDAVKYEEYLTSAELTSAPSANIDRAFSDQTTNTWESAVKAQAEETAIASVGVITSFNEATREFKVDLTANFTSKPNGQVRFGAIILENGITGPAPDYNQSNAYGNGANGAMEGFEELGRSISANMIAYNHVSRQLLGGYSGAEESLPASIELNQDYTYSFTHVLPDEWDEDQVYAVGLLLNTANGTIENAGKSNFLDGTSNATPKFSSKPKATGYLDKEYAYTVYGVDADDADLSITLLEGPEWLSLGTVSFLGNIHTKAMLSGTPTATGVYDVKLEVGDGDKSTQQTFSIEVIEAPENDWVLAGREGFTGGAASIFDLAIGSDNSLYVAASLGESLEVYRKRAGGDWQSMGLSALGGRHAQLAVGSDNRPYIIYSLSSGTRVSKWNGSAWEQVGGVAPSGVQIGFALDENDVPYFCMQDGSSSYQGNAYSLQNNQWVKLGGTKYSHAEGVWNSCDFGPNGEFYVLWNDFNGGRKPYVSTLEGGNWTQLGEGAVSDGPVSFYQKVAVGPSGDVYVAAVQEQENNLNVYELVGEKWVLMGSDLIGDHSISEIDMSVSDNGTIVIAYVDESEGDEVSCVEYDGSSWSVVGIPGFSGAASGSPQIVHNDNIPYVAFTDFANGGAATVRSYGEDPTYIGRIPSSKKESLAFPNPVSQSFYISLTEEAHLELFTARGQSVLSQQVLPGAAIDVSELKPGLYLARIKGDNTSLIERIILK